MLLLLHVLSQNVNLVSHIPSTKAQGVWKIILLYAAETITWNQVRKLLNHASYKSIEIIIVNTVNKLLNWYLNLVYTEN